MDCVYTRHGAWAMRGERGGRYVCTLGFGTLFGEMRVCWGRGVGSDRGGGVGEHDWDGVIFVCMCEGVCLLR